FAVERHLITLNVSGVLCSANGLILHPNGKLYLSDSLASRIFSLDVETHQLELVTGDHSGYESGTISHSGYKDGTLKEALFHFPIGLAVDPQGRILVADMRNDRVRRIDLATGTVCT